MSSRRTKTDLFFVSLVLLFLELACIRWFPAHVLFLTFFTNTILLATFLGMSIGCLVADDRRNFLTYTPILLVLAMLSAQLVAFLRHSLEMVLRVGNPLSPQLVFFGTEYAAGDPTQFVVPIEVVEAFFFLLVALIMVGPGQELGRALKRVPHRLHAYTLNILGSLAGILLFAIGSWYQLSPVWWFGGIVFGLGYFLFAPSPVRRPVTRADVLPALGLVVAVAFWTSGIKLPGNRQDVEHIWSPYYRVDYDRAHDKAIAVNLIGHQQMVSRDDQARPSYAYAVPYLLRRHTTGQPLDNVLIIGAGSGNDVSRALAFGARHIDAVEIDPAIQRLGARDHPDHPYQDPRVTVHIDDGRNFLRETNQTYDLVVFALVDSLVLHSGYSNIRLESFLFTREALDDVRRHLRPGGVLVMYNLFRQGWIVDRLSQEVEESFGARPLVMTLPSLETIEPETTGGFTILLGGATEPIRDAFDRHQAYWLQAERPPSLATPNGFEARPSAGEQSDWLRLGLARVLSPASQRSATDNWPFLYLRGPMIPALSLRGMAIMGGVGILLFGLFARSGGMAGTRGLNGRMFWLGAGFMLVETHGVVAMALLFGSTWTVNAIVFAGVLTMILLANLYVARLRPSRLVPYYIGLMIALGLNVVIPFGALLGWSRAAQVIVACLLAFAPVFFSGVIFAVAFGRSSRPDRDFGANVLGAMLGGLAENSSMLLGFRYVTFVMMAFYLFSALFAGSRSMAGQDEPVQMQG